MNTSKKFLCAMCTLCMILAMAVPAFAASGPMPRAATHPYSLVLPSNKGDAETKLIEKTGRESHFYVDFTSAEVDAVNVWTENEFGYNFSSTSTQVGTNTWHDVDYTTTPSKGNVVKMNMDNPVSAERTYDVAGNWTPF